MGQPTEVTQRILQEYLEALAEVQEQPEAKRAKQLLTSYAEFRFHFAGGSRCAQCNASVRHVLPVTIARRNGDTEQYPCLCFRCIEAERTTALYIEIGVGETVWMIKGRDVSS